MSSIRQPERVKSQPASAQSRPAGPAMRDALLSALLVAVVFLVFSPVREFSFLNYDDDGYVTANPHVQQGLTPGGVSWAFSTITAANWHPLTWISLMLNEQLSGPGPAGFHLANLLLHAA